MKNVSIIVPVKDEEATIQPLIDSMVLQSELPKEVIFVDGGSTDRTRDIINQNVSKVPFKLVLIELEQAYPGVARNVGAYQASCDIIAFTDAGITLDKRWLEELMKPLEADEETDAVYGAYQPIVNSFIKECSLIAYMPPKEKIDNKIFRTNFIASSIFKKRIWTAVGGFPPFRAAEDKIFMEKVKQLKANIKYTDKAMAHWEIPGTIKGIYRRFCEFSAHDLLAGRASDWHYSVLKTYLVILALMLLAFFVNKYIIGGVLAVLILRIIRIFIKHRRDFRLKFLFDIRYLVTIVIIIFITDLAMFTGSLKWLAGYAIDA